MQFDIQRRDNEKPISGARVEVVEIGAGQVGAGTTNYLGWVNISWQPLPGSEEKHARYRAKVSAPGYKSTWSDIPDDLLTGKSRADYVIYVDPEPRSQSVANFAGNWDTKVGRLGHYYLVKLNQRGNRVEGSYDDLRGVTGTISGLIDGDTLTYTWQERAASGTGVFRISKDGQRISGTYSQPGYPDNNWSGSKKP